MDKPKSGLTAEEQKISDLLVEALNAFLYGLGDAILPYDQQQAFIHAIHDAQGVLMHRVIVRDYPEYWK